MSVVSQYPDAWPGSGRLGYRPWYFEIIPRCNHASAIADSKHRHTGNNYGFWVSVNTAEICCHDTALYEMPTCVPRFGTENDVLPDRAMFLVTPTAWMLEQAQAVLYPGSVWR